jgi:hypothetical protein
MCRVTKGSGEEPSISKWEECFFQTKKMMQKCDSGKIAYRAVYLAPWYAERSRYRWRGRKEVALIRDRLHSCSSVNHNRHHSIRKSASVETRITRSRTCSQQCSDTTVVNDNSFTLLYVYIEYGIDGSKSKTHLFHLKY